MSFYVFLPSNDVSYQENSPNEFRVRLSEPLNLSGGFFEVALVELLCHGASTTPRAHRERRFEIPYFANMESIFQSNKTYWGRVWAEGDLEVYVSWRAPGTAERFAWFMRNSGNKTIALELPSAFMDVFKFGAWKKFSTQATGLLHEPGDDMLQPADGSYLDLVKPLSTTLSVVSESYYMFHCILSPGEAIRLASNYDTEREEQWYTKVHKHWRRNRVWRFSKTYVDTAMPPSETVKTVYMYCYTDIIEYQAVGSKSVPLLRVVELQKKSDGELVRDSGALQTPFYLKLNRQEIHEISIRISDQRGRAFNFHLGAHIVVVLHFRRRSE